MVENAIDEGLRAHSAGRLAEAEAIYRRILKDHPDHPGALHLLGVALSQQGNKPAAIGYISRAVALNPEDPDFQANLGLAYLENGEATQAAAACQRALKLKPDHIDALHQLGNALRHLGRLEESIEPLQRAIALRPDFTMAMTNLADALRKLNRNAEADAFTEKILTFHPDDLSALACRGESLLQRKKPRQAAELFRGIVEKWPNEWVGHNGLGVALCQLGKIEEAIPECEKATALAPGHPGPWNNLGFARVGKGLIEDGIECYRKSLAIRPDSADTHNNLASAFLAKLDLEAAMRSYTDALYFQPDHADAHWNRALLDLLRGDFERGWVEYEWRWLKFPEFRRHFRQPLWDGFDISGKTILLHAEQGFGDTIQFVRLAPLVAERGATVNLECPRELEGLLQHVDGVARTFTGGDKLPPFDVHCPLMSIPRALRLTSENIPNAVPYLHADSNLIKSWAARIRPHAGKFNIGIVWAGAPIHRRDAERSIPPAVFAPLSKIDGVQLFSLQKDALTGAATDLPLVDLTRGLHDFADTAALMMNLDLIIGVDTAVVHLAGALGRKVWTLLPFSPDWRWLLNRDDSPWYPTMRLFRQTAPGDWNGPLGRVTEALATESQRLGRE